METLPNTSISLIGFQTSYSVKPELKAVLKIIKYKPDPVNPIKDVHMQCYWSGQSI